MKIKIVAFYHFFKPNFDLHFARTLLRQRMIEQGIKGSILLAFEGINSSLAGPIKEMDFFIPFLLETIHITNPILKISYADTVPFKRSLVKVKPEIVAEPGTAPIPLEEIASVPYLAPEELNRWIKESRPMVLLDTRNNYEYQVGRFKDSIHLDTKHFVEFEKKLENTPEEWKNTPIVTFCTGGIRCEKAAPLMIKKGFREVYQLEGGILNYFEKIGRGYFEGNCFVFDQREALDEQLNPAHS